jgi:hypothetical protein
MVIWLNVMVELGGGDLCMPEQLQLKLDGASYSLAIVENFDKVYLDKFLYGPQSRRAASRHTLFDVPEGISGNVRRSGSHDAFMPATAREKDDPNHGALPAELATDSPYLLEGDL